MRSAIEFGTLGMVGGESDVGSRIVLRVMLLVVTVGCAVVGGDGPALACSFPASPIAADLADGDGRLTTGAESPLILRGVVAYRVLATLPLAPGLVRNRVWEPVRRWGEAWPEERGFGPDLVDRRWDGLGTSSCSPDRVPVGALVHWAWGVDAGGEPVAQRVEDREVVGGVFVITTPEEVAVGLTGALGPSAELAGGWTAVMVAWVRVAWPVSLVWSPVLAITAFVVRRRRRRRSPTTAP